MTVAFKLPALGADMDKGTLLEWLVKPGDAVRRGQVVAVVDTSKAAIEVESWDEGVVHRLLVEPGAELQVGQRMAWWRGADESVEAAEAWIAAQAAAQAAAAVAPAGATASADAAGAVGTAAAPPAAAAGATPARRRVSPAARRRAQELQVDVDAIAQGSGPDGAIAIEDVERGASARPAPAAPPAPLDKAAAMRAQIATSMSRSKREIPHYYLSQSISLKKARDWLGAYNAARPLPQRLLMAALLVKATALALRQFPELNGVHREGVYVPSAAVHLGIAISLRGGGLVAPALHDADRRGLPELMQALNDLVRRARQGSLRSSEMSDPTATLSNLGDLGVESVYAVIFPPQVALVGLGAVAERPWVADGTLVVHPTVVASLAADHRVSDGHRGGQFLAALDALLQQPETL